MKALHDCHVLIHWSGQVNNWVKEHMACMKCGKVITKFDHWTIGIAMALDFHCTFCQSYATVHVLTSNDVREHLENDDFIPREH
jgi:hypothetical protein